MESINIGYVSDTKGLDFAIISMLSVLKNSNYDDYINFFFIIDEFFRDIHVKKLMTLNTNKSTIHIYKINSKRFIALKKTTKRKDLPINTYYRLFFAEAFPYIDKLIYLDYDTYINRSLNDLFSIDINNVYLGAIEDIWQDKRINELKRIGINTSFHFNSGVLLLNLKKWRKESIFDQLINFSKNYIDSFTLADQFLLNSFFSFSDTQLLVLPYKFNFQMQQHSEPTQYRDLSSYYNSINNLYVVHFVFGKPWEFEKCSHVYRSLWWNVARSYLFYEEMIYSNIILKDIYNILLLNSLKRYIFFYYLTNFFIIFIKSSRLRNLRKNLRKKILRANHMKNKLKNYKVYKS